MAVKYGRPYWYLVSFFVVGLAQHPMIVGISLPLYSVRFGAESSREFGVLDAVATVMCVSGILIATISDNQLRNYVLENARRRAAGEPVVPVLEQGLWRYSRHPNYFGEQLWWWSLSLFSIQCGQPWAIAGTAFNSLILYIVTDLTENKMLEEWDAQRADLFRGYKKRTSRCLLLPPKKDKIPKISDDINEKSE